MRRSKPQWSTMTQPAATATSVRPPTEPSSRPHSRPFRRTPHPGPALRRRCCGLPRAGPNSTQSAGPSSRPLPWHRGPWAPSRPDGDTGENAWRIDRLELHRGLTRALRRAALRRPMRPRRPRRGWRLAARLRVRVGHRRRCVLRVRERPWCRGRPLPAVYVTVDGDDLLVRDDGGTGDHRMRAAGAADGRYHEVVLVRSPRAPRGAGRRADVRWTARRSASCARAGSNGNAAGGGRALRRRAPAAGTVTAHFRSVVFSLGPPVDGELAAVGPVVAQHFPGDLVDVFVGGRGVPRIPHPRAARHARAATVLAFAEGRQTLSDHAQQRHRRAAQHSTEGATFGAMQVIADEGLDSPQQPLRRARSWTGPHAPGGSS
jgi:hypothetical protein